MRLDVEHRTAYAYEPAVAGLALRLRLFARPTAQQRVLDWRVEVDGDPIEPLITTAYGEPEALWFARRASDTAEIVARGTIETSDNAGVLGRETRLRPAIYLRETRLTKTGEAVRAVSAKAEGDGPLARMHALNAAVREALDYREGATDSATTAEEAARIGAGVCQDFAHLFVAAARALDVPARYVVGYLHDEAAPELASHAWAEAHLEGLGWVGFDPVHDVCPTTAHVRLATGFDAFDAAPIRGTMRPGVEETMTVSVSVAPAGQTQRQGPEGQSQTQ
ncbi:MAG: transglutaminase domain-containing protein [Paracoccaceae bacterium]